MSVTCPYCRNVIKLKSVKPGRFTPKCPKCAKPFILTVPADTTKPLVATPLPTPTPAAAGAAVGQSALEQTTQVLPEAARARSAPAAASAPAVDQTVALPPEPKSDQTAVLPPGADLGQTAALSSAPGATGAWSAPAGSPLDRTEAVAPSAAVDEAAALVPSGTGGTAGDATEAGQPGVDGDDGAPRSLGGYTVIKLLGKGGMGAVYLARQVSLDRDVALKVMNSRTASDPTFVARFTREAYAAAQLVHHNIIQIYDIGEEHGMPFFSMEFVRGKNLAEVAGTQGKLDADEAVGYVLQAARGLKFAHDQGMVHRDIKPDNLMLNDQGIVKVADLGLVKTASMSAAEDQGSDRPPSLTGLSSLPSVTNVGVAMGTPLYMAPEQGRNAASVDHRADIYSLGCTLYVLLTGRPPFVGKTPMEVMTKHLTEPVTPPEVYVKRVPKELSVILLRMLAKKPEERYADLGAVIADLEKFLGVVSAGAFTPKEEHAATLEAAVKQFNNAPAARQRAVAVPAFFGVLALLIFLCVVLGKPAWALAVIGLGGLTLVGTFLTSGVIYRTHLFLKAREAILDSTLSERVRGGLYALMFVSALWLFGLVPVLIGMVLLAAGVCALYHILIERQLVTERAKALAKAEGLLKTLRLRGLEEEALRQFVAKYSGDNWEELYEALFGYDLMIRARQRLAATEGGKRRARHAAWRDPIIHWMESRQRQARERRERKLLQKLEQKRLEAEGVTKNEAKARAEAAADVLVEGAAGMKQVAEAKPAAAAGTPTAPPKPLFNMKQLMEAAEKAEKGHAKRMGPKGPGLFKILYSVTIGPQPRFLLAAILIFGCSLWVSQNPELQDAFRGTTRSLSDEGKVKTNPFAVETHPLTFGNWIPRPISLVFDSFNPAVAAVLLIISALWRSHRITIAFFIASAILLVGPQAGVPQLKIPLVGDLSSSTLSLAGGLAVAVLGVVVERLMDRDDPNHRRW